MKIPIGIILIAGLVLNGCASMESLNKQKVKLETAIQQQETVTNEEIAKIEAEIKAIEVTIDKSIDLSKDASNNEKISALQEKVNDVTVKGRDKVDKLSIKLREIEDKITSKMNTKNIDSY